jgi:hypothetical protein
LVPTSAIAAKDNVVIMSVPLATMLAMVLSLATAGATILTMADHGHGRRQRGSDISAMIAAGPNRAIARGGRPARKRQI